MKYKITYKYTVNKDVKNTGSQIINKTEIYNKEDGARFASKFVDMLLLDINEGWQDNPFTLIVEKIK